MIGIDEALRLVLENLPQPRMEQVSLHSAQGRVIAGDLRATMDIPPFRRSSMDGFALRSEDVQNAPSLLNLAGEVRAGSREMSRLRPGEAMSIMTGAPVPDGADAVQVVEKARRAGGRVEILEAVRQGENITPAGFEASFGETVLPAGEPLGPAALAVLATFGFDPVRVFVRPTVAVVATGDELVEADQVPAFGQIRNSNMHSLSAQLRLMGIEPDYLGIARDDKPALRRKIEEGLRRDVLILTGGVSMGDYDFVRDVFEELGLRIIFTRVAMKPGKPTVFASKAEKLVFGLPGNPVSTFVAFENFVRPALGRLCGMRHPELPRIRGELSRELRQKPGRTAFLPARVYLEETRWRIAPCTWKGSADIIGFSRANAAVIFPGDRDHLREGEQVEAMLLPDFHWLSL